MKILGNRLLVSRIEEEQTEGFKAVDVQDSFVYKGKVELIGWNSSLPSEPTGVGLIKKGDIVLFAKYSPNTQEIPVEGKTMKIISVDDVLAVE